MKAPFQSDSLVDKVGPGYLADVAALFIGVRWAQRPRRVRHGRRESVVVDGAQTVA